MLSKAVVQIDDLESTFPGLSHVHPAAAPVGLDSAPASTTQASSSDTSLILRELCIIKRQLRTVTRLIAQCQKPTSIEEEVNALLPLKTEEDVDELEKKLRSSQQFYTQMVNLLTGVGGSNVNSAASRVMARLFEDQLGQKYSLYGQKGKLAFSNLQLFTVLQKAVRQMPGMSMASLRNIQDGVKTWLKNCPARVKTAAKKNRSMPGATDPAQ
ncbi:uncharacterized protein LOC125943377 [Dermacentor silvarum]|uniref:uncharacterized protein LOC125943377 n=1 Tax=Dermacentor silvarum TaxID=543639 RepID=UPI0021007BA6|nr:uncharacterized protein LOC125943377 [Dermacentor silvarum]